MHALVIEDDKGAAVVLSHMLREHCSVVTSVCIANTVSAAKQEVRQRVPDLLFLDIMVEGVNLLETVREWVSTTVPIIVTTGFDDYAFMAIDAGVVAYLLKPIELSALKSAVDKAKNSFLLKPRTRGKLLVKSVASLHVLSVEEIVRAEASNGYTLLHFIDKEPILISKPIGEVNLQLNEKSGFVRTHKSHLVNIKKVVEIRTGRNMMVVMRGQAVVPLAQRRRDHLLALFSSLVSL